jgi:hypothetical protein
MLISTHHPTILKIARPPIFNVQVHEGTSSPP